ncbi:MAG: hypothetical protein LBE91_02710 [Tannerella sp.]|nr:hypothetical protein [Tannerella sp.]
MKKVAFILTLAIFSHSLQAQQNSDKTVLAVELDPAPYILGGYSVFVRYKKAESKIAVAAAVFGGNKFPDFLMSKENKDNGFKDQKHRMSYAVFADYFPKGEHKGLYLGPSLFLYNHSVSKTGSSDIARFSKLYPNMRVGYIWYPFQKNNFYLSPWASFGSEISLDSKNEINGVEYKPNKFNYIVAVHIGYSFSLSKKQ